MKCIKATKQDSLQIARLHKAFIPTGFLSQQSLNFLNALYLFLIMQEIVYVVKEEENVVGFIAGSLNTDGLYKRFLKSNVPLLIAFALRNLFSIDFIRKAAETFTAPKKTVLDDLDYAVPELLSIVVDKSYAGKGYGKELLGCLEQEFRRSNAKDYKVLVGSQLEANRFYVNNGFVRVKEIELHKSAISYLYVKTFQQRI